MTPTIRRIIMMLIAAAVMAAGAVRARVDHPQAGSRGIMSAIPEIPSNKWAAASNAASATIAPRAVFTRIASSGKSAMRSALISFRVSGVAGQWIDRKSHSGSMASRLSWNVAPASSSAASRRWCRRRPPRSDR